MKIIMVILLSMIVAGCGQFERVTATVAGHSETCIDGVTYIQFTSGACVKVDINGKPVGCK